MSSKTLMLVFLPVAILCILALVWDGQGGESVAGPTLVAGPANEPSARPYGDRVETRRDAKQEIESLSQELADEQAAPQLGPLTPVGHVSGRLVDAAGRGIPNEPVVCALANDPFVRGDEDDDDWRVIARAVSDAEGRFRVGGHPNVVLKLMAGGNRWSRRMVDPVVNDDDLVVTLEQGYVLEGTVFDSSGLALEGAHVGAGADSITYTTRSDESGRFRLGPLPAEDVLVGAWAPGHDVWFDGASPALGGVTVELEPAPTVTGRAVDRDTGEPVRAGEVVLRLDTHAFPAGTSQLVPEHVAVHAASVELDGEGGFAIEGGVSFGFVLDVLADGYVPLEYDRYEDRGWSASRSDIVLHLRPAEPVVGTAYVHATGAPARGALVSLESGDTAVDGLVVHGEADDQGRFELPVTDWEGRDRLYVVAEDAQGNGGRVRSREASEDLELRLVPKLDVLVRVTKGGEPAAGAQIVASSQGSLPTHATSDEQGLARVSHLLAGPEVERVRLSARDTHDRSLPLVIDLEEEPRPDPDVPLELALDGGTFLEGFVSDPFGNPIASALLEVRRGPLAHTDPEGRFSLGPLALDDDITLDISADDFHDRRMEFVPSEDELHVTLQPVLRWKGRVIDTATGQAPDGFFGRLQFELEDDGALVWRDTDTRFRELRGSSGEFSVALADTGRFRLRFSSQGYVDAVTGAIDFDGLHAPVYTDVFMSPAALLEVMVMDGAGRPVPGLTVTAVPWAVADGDQVSGQARKQGHRARTREDGKAAINLGQGGNFRLTLGSTWVDALPISVTPGPPVPRVLTVPATGDLEVAILDEEGEPLRGGRLSLRSTGPDYSISRRGTVRSHDARVTFNALPPGPYSVVANYRGRPPTGVEVVVREAGFEQVDLSVPQTPPEPPPGQEGDAAGVINVYGGMGGGMGGMGGGMGGGSDRF